jgi:hypothetical protein
MEREEAITYSTIDAMNGDGAAGAPLKNRNQIRNARLLKRAGLKP